MAKSIMIQGTMSGVGKSLLTAALCRIFRQDGYRVAPFKAQNMALNSFVTAEGLEIGRAQAMQAQAAEIAPSALMNPVLLKPLNNTGSQVIVNGKPLGNMEARPYFRYRKSLLPVILESYQTLAAQYDILVIEGAGSPAELNLRKDDIVNMGLAQAVHAPVLLTGDIDRGGVFAQLLGTLSLLEQTEQALVKGLLVNKFRGDVSLFADGVKILEEKSGLPVLGVIPCLACQLEEEDSTSDFAVQSGGGVDIAVIRLPRMSNFTDFDVFSQYQGVSVRYISDVQQFGKPDLLLLPGTKHTIADMQWLHDSGLSAVILQYAASGKPLFGICGGFQILGKRISDPDGTEGGGSIAGLGLLPCETVLGKEKELRQISGTFHEIPGLFGCLSGAAFQGYEIHHGKTITAASPLTSCGGAFSGNVAGCYVHGIFDQAEVSSRLIQALCQQKQLPFSPGISRAAYRERQFDLLAAGVREAIDLSKIYHIIEEGV